MRSSGTIASNALIAFDVIIVYTIPVQPHETPMTTLTIRNVEPAVKEKLRVRAAHNGRSMEAELRAILTEAIGPTRDREPDLAESIRRRFEPFGGVELDLPPRLAGRDPPRFE